MTKQSQCMGVVGRWGEREEHALWVLAFHVKGNNPCNYKYYFEPL